MHKEKRGNIGAEAGLCQEGREELKNGAKGQGQGFHVMNGINGRKAWTARRKKKEASSHAGRSAGQLVQKGAGEQKNGTALISSNTKNR